MKPLQLALAASLIGASPVAPAFLLQAARAADNAAQRAGRAAIVAQYKKSDDAIVRQDVAGVMKIIADDYRGYGLDGKIENRAQSEASMRATMSGKSNGIAMKFVKSQTKILGWTWRGPDAVVRAQTTMVGVGRAGGKSVRIEVVGVARDYWGKTRRGWQVRQSVSLEMKRWINGVRDATM